MPLIFPWHGVVRDDWMNSFLELYEQCGLDINKVPLDPLLPAPKPGGFYARPLSTSEASVWLKLLLRGTANSEIFRSHSLKCTMLSWCAQSGLDKECRAVLAHHCSALTGSEVVYSRQLQVRAIRKLQMLLHRVRAGLGVDEDVDNSEQHTQMSAGMTPRSMFKKVAPSTPMPESPPLHAGRFANVSTPGIVESAAAEVLEAEDHEAVKEEAMDMDAVVEAADSITLFGADLTSKGLIQIDSSSGSSSDSDSDSSTDSSTPTPVAPVDCEVVPEGVSYYKHIKSLILHRCVTGSDVASCGAKLSSNFKDVGRSFSFKFPKCLKCFPKDNQRIRDLDALTDALDKAVHRARKS